MHFETIEIVLTLLKAGVYATGLFTSGGILFSLLFRSDITPIQSQLNRHIKKLSLWGLGLITLNYAATLFWLSGGEIEDFASPDMIELVVLSTGGKLQLLLGAGFVLIILATHKRDKLLSILGIIIVLAPFISTGHTGLYESPYFLKPLLMMHLLIACFWAGSFVPLLLLLKEHEELAAPTLERFGKIASWAIPVLLLSGLTMSWFIAGGTKGLFATAYGWTLLGKLVLVWLVLCLATANKFKLVPALNIQNLGSGFYQQTITRLRRSIKTETALVLFVLLITAVFTTLISPADLGHRLS